MHAHNVYRHVYMHMHSAMCTDMSRPHHGAIIAPVNALAMVVAQSNIELGIDIPMCGHAYRHVLRYVHRSINMCVAMYIDMCIDMCVDICIDMCIGIGMDMCIGMCIDMCTDMRTDICTGVRSMIACR